LVTLDGIVTLVINEFEKAKSPIEVTLGGTIAEKMVIEEEVPVIVVATPDP
jgi:hypothetical protein